MKPFPLLSELNVNAKLRELKAAVAEGWLILSRVFFRLSHHAFWQMLLTFKSNLLPPY
jgi:hypothetical protein